MRKLTLDPSEWNFAYTEKHRTHALIPPTEVEPCFLYEYGREALQSEYVIRLRKDYLNSAKGSRGKIFFEACRVLRRLRGCLFLFSQKADPKPWLKLKPREKEDWKQVLRETQYPENRWSGFRAKLTRSSSEFDDFRFYEEFWFTALVRAQCPPILGYFALNPEEDLTKIVKDFEAWLKAANILQKKLVRKRPGGDKAYLHRLRGLAAWRILKANEGRSLMFRSGRTDAGRPAHDDKKVALYHASGAILPFSNVGEFKSGAAEAEAFLEGLLGKDSDEERAEAKAASDSFRRASMAGEYGPLS